MNDKNIKVLRKTTSSHILNVSTGSNTGTGGSYEYRLIQQRKKEEEEKKKKEEEEQKKKASNTETNANSGTESSLSQNEPKTTVKENQEAPKQSSGTSAEPKLQLPVKQKPVSSKENLTTLQQIKEQNQLIKKEKTKNNPYSFNPEAGLDDGVQSMWDSFRYRYGLLEEQRKPQVPLAMLPYPAQIDKARRDKIEKAVQEKFAEEEAALNVSKVELGSDDTFYASPIVIDGKIAHNKQEMHQIELDNLEKRKAEYRKQLMDILDPNTVQSQVVQDYSVNVDDPNASNFYGLVSKQIQLDQLVKQETNDDEYKIARNALKYNRYASDKAKDYVSQVNQLSSEATRADYDVDRYLEKTQSVSRYIATNGLPSNMKYMPKHIKEYMNDMGILYVYFDQQTGKLNDVYPGSEKVDLAKKLTVEDADAIIENTGKQTTLNLGASVDAEALLESLSNEVEFQQEKYKMAHQRDIETGEANQYGSLTEQAKYNTKGQDSYDFAREQIEKARKHILRDSQVKRAEGGLFGWDFLSAQTWKNVGLGAYDVLQDADTYTFGIAGLQEANKTSAFLNKYNSGKNLTGAEKALAESFALEAYIHGEHGNYENVTGYKAGKTAMESAKFMLETALTEGALSGISKAARGANISMKAAATARMEAISRAYAKRYGSGTLGTFVGRQWAKSPEFMKLVGLLAGQSMIMANTIQLPEMISGIKDLLMGQAQFRTTDDGRIVFDGFGGGMNLLDAAVTQEISMTNENLSEFAGEWGLGKFISKPLSKYVWKPMKTGYGKFLGTEVGSSVAGGIERGINHLTNKEFRLMIMSSPKRSIGGFLEAAHVGGLGGEIAEEYYGMVMNRIGDNIAHQLGINSDATQSEYSLWDDINPFTEHGRETFFDIAYGIALSQGAMGAAGAVNSARISRNFHKSEQKAKDVFGSRFEYIQKALTESHTDNLGHVANVISSGLLNAEERRVFQDYYKSLGQYRGSNSARIKQMQDNDEDLHNKALDQSRKNGYTAQANGIYRDLTPAVELMHQNTLKQLNTTEEEYQQKVADAGGIYSFAKQLDDAGMSTSAEQILAEDKLKALHEGSLKLMDDDIQTKLDNNAEFVERIQSEDGNVIEAQTKNGNRVFILRGSRKSEDGSINSDENLVITDLFGNVRTEKASNLKDFSLSSKDKVKNLIDKQIFTDNVKKYNNQTPGQTKFGESVHIFGDKFGVILGRANNGRIMYSINDGQNEEILFTEEGQTEQDLLNSWNQEHLRKMSDQALTDAQKELALSRQINNGAQVVAGEDVLKYINNIIVKQHADMLNGKGTPIAYAEGKKLEKGVAKQIVGVLRSMPGYASNIKTFSNILNYITASSENAVDGLVIDAQYWPRFGRILNAWRNGNITDEELEYILDPENSKLPEWRKEYVNSLVFDRYGEVKQTDDYGKKYIKHVKFGGSRIGRRFKKPVDEYEIFKTPIVSQQTGQTTLEETKSNQESEPVVDNGGNNTVPPIDNGTSDNTDQTPEEPEDTGSSIYEYISGVISSILNNAVAKNKNGNKLVQAVRRLMAVAENMNGKIINESECSMFIVDNEGKVSVYRNNQFRFGGVFDSRNKFVSFWNRPYDEVRQDIQNHVFDAISSYRHLDEKEFIDAVNKAIANLEFNNVGYSQQYDFSAYLQSYLNDRTVENQYDIAELIATEMMQESQDQISLRAERTINHLIKQFFRTGVMPAYDEQTMSRYLSKDAYDLLLEQSVLIAKVYDAMNWKIVCDDNIVFTHTVYDKDRGRDINVATRPDMIAVDENGGYHVIDIATAYRYFDKERLDEKQAEVELQRERERKRAAIEHREEKPIEDYFNWMSEFTPHWLRDRGKETVRSIKDQYELFLTLQLQIIESHLGVCESIELQPWKLDYDNRLSNTPGRVYKVDLSKQVTLEFGGKKEKTKQPQRIVLVRSGQVLDRFDEDDYTIIEQAKQHVEMLIESVSQFNPGAIFDGLDEDTKRLYDSIINEYTRLIEEYKEMYNSGIFTNYDELKEIYNEIQRLSNLRDDCARWANEYNNRSAVAATNDTRDFEAPDEYLQEIDSDAKLLSLEIQQTLCDLLDKIFKNAEWIYNNKPQLNGKIVISNNLYMQMQRMIETARELAILTDDITQNISTLRIDQDIFGRFQYISNWFIHSVVPQTAVPVAAPIQINTGHQSVPKKDQYKIAMATNSLTTQRIIDPATNEPYKTIDTAVDENGIPIGAFMENANFVDDSEFELVVLDTEKNLSNPKIHIRITYTEANGTVHTFEPIAMNTSDKFAQEVANKVKTLLPSEKLILARKPLRSPGIQAKNQTGESKNLTASELGLISMSDDGTGVSIYDIGFDLIDGCIGITYTVSGEGKTKIMVPKQADDIDKAQQSQAGVFEGHVFLTHDEHTLSMGRVLHEGKELAKSIQNGFWAFLRRHRFTETQKNNTEVIIMDKPKLSPGDIEFIVLALTGAFNRGNYGVLDQYCEVNGTPLGCSILDIVDLLIPCSTIATQEMDPNRMYEGKTIPPCLRVEYKNGNPKSGVIVTILNNFPGRQQNASYTFDLSNQAGINNFVQTISNFTLHISTSGFANSRFEKNSYIATKLRNLHEGSLSYFSRNKGASFRFGNSRISFDEQDFNHVDKHGVSKPISGLGWYIKNGYVQTRYSGTMAPGLSFKEEDGTVVMPVTDNSSQEQAPISEQSRNMIETYMKKFGVDFNTAKRRLELLHNRKLNKIQKGEAKHKIDKDKAIADLKKILGELITVRFEEGYLSEDDQVLLMQLMLQPGGVVGRCYADFIELSELAEEGTLFHEAFHRVLELLMTDKERDTIYKKYRATHKLDKSVTDLDIAELIADEFMYYMQNKAEFKWSNGIIGNIKQIAKWVNMFKHVGNYTLYTAYVRAKNGKYAQAIVTPQAKERFARFTEGKNYLNTEIHGKKYENIISLSQYYDIIDFLIYGALHHSGQDIQWDGGNIDKFKVSREIFDSKEFEKCLSELPEAHQEAVREMLDSANWDRVLSDLMARMATFMSTPKLSEQLEINKVIERNQNSETTEFGEQQDTNDDEDESESTFEKESFKEAYEFSQFSRSTPRVKFFVSGIVNMMFDQDGNTIPVLNGAGFQNIVSTYEVFDLLISKCGDCADFTEVRHRIAEYATQNPIFAQLNERVLDVWDRYKKSRESGNVDADLEAFISQFMTCVKCATLNSVMMLSLENGGKYEISLVDVDLQHNSDQYILSWSEQFALGFSSLFRKNAQGEYEEGENFSRKINFTTRWFSNLIDNAQNVDNGATGVIGIIHPGSIYSLGNNYDVYNIKRDMCHLFTKCGVWFTVAQLDEYLEAVYGASDKTAFCDFIKQNKTEIESFIEKIKNVGSPTGEYIGEGQFAEPAYKLAISEDKLGGVDITQYLKGCEMLKVLSNARYLYERKHKQMSARIAGDAKQYSKSENNLLSSRITSLRKNDSEIQKMRSSLYNRGSILLGAGTKALQRLTYTTFVGAKTTARGDSGSDYTKIAKREDWLAKAQMLRQGKFIFPTMSDKKTYGAIDPMDFVNYEKPTLMPGLTITKINKLFLESGFVVNGDYIQPFDDAAIDQLIKYATSEYEAIGRLLKLICVDKVNLGDEIDLSLIKYRVKNFHDGQKIFVWADGTVLSEKELDLKIDEMYKADVEEGKKSADEIAASKKATKKECTKTIVQGARFTSLLGIYDAKDGFIDFNRIKDENGKYVSASKCYKLAGKYFFELRENETPEEMLDRQRQAVKEQLQRLVDKQLLDLCSMELIKKDENGLYDNVGLNNAEINLIANQISSQTRVLDEQGRSIPTRTDQLIMSMAIRLYVGDVVARHVISMNEVERLLSGRLAFFKWQYNSDGTIKDMKADWSKRLGGLVSTGLDNNMAIDGFINEDGSIQNDAVYNSAIVSNEMVQGAHIEELERRIYQSEMRNNIIYSMLNYATSLFELTREEFCDLIDGMTDEEFDDFVGTQIACGNIDPAHVELFKTKAKQKSDAFRKDKKHKGVDVADGAAYMSDVMCERLLRMCGSYSSDIQRAFKILRGETVDGKVYTTRRILDDAYQQVVTAVIGAQKYTAYGFRYEDGEAVPYYNKMALFPLFKSICTGNMSKIYDQMRRQKIDILHVESAVKVGISDSTEIDWDTVGTSDNFFSVRKLRYADLRKQFNTDPKGEEMRALGTQMTKIVMAALNLNRDYNGRRGRELRDDIMNCINSLSKNGYNKVMSEFFDTDANGNIKTDEHGNYVPNVVKFSEMLTEELKSRNASWELIDAVSVITVNGKKDFKVPLSALSSMDFIQSILTSYINKRVVDINMPGTAFYQRSVWGMEGHPTVLDDEDLPDEINMGRKLEVWNELNSMDCVVSIDFYEHILAKARKKTGNKVAKRDKDGNVVKTKKYLRPDGTEITPIVIALKIYELHPEIRNALQQIKDNDNGSKPLTAYWGSTTNTNFDVTGKTKEDFEKEAIAAMGYDVNSYVEEDVMVDEYITYDKLPFKEQERWLIDNGHISGFKHTSENPTHYYNPTLKRIVEIDDDFRADMQTYAWSNAKTSIIGSRIPTQAISSIHAMRCVGVLPVVRDTIILPQEFTTITGSDFDIDKLFLAIKHYSVDRKTNMSTDQFEEGSDLYYGNRLMDNYITLLTNDRDFNLLNGSIDKDTEPIQDIEKDLTDSGKNASRLASYDTFSIKTQVDTKDEFVNGKIGIGPFALNNNSHVLTKLYNVVFNIKSKVCGFLRTLGMTKLNLDIDRNGRSISSWLSGLINAHVDVAKDSYVSRLDVNPYTYNLTNLFVRTGMSDNAFFFLCQPIMKQLSYVYQTASSSYMSNPALSKSQRQQDAEENWVKEFATKNFTDFGYDIPESGFFTKRQVISQFQKQFEKKYEVSVDYVAKHLFDGNAPVLHKLAKGSKTENLTDGAFLREVNTVNGVDLTNFEVQMITLYIKDKLNTPAKRLADVVKYSKIDTKKLGKSVIEQWVYKRGYERVFHSDIAKEWFVNLDRMAEDSYIEKKTQYATDALQKILSPYFIGATDKMLNGDLVRCAGEILGDVDEDTYNRALENVDFVKQLEKSIEASLKAKWFFGSSGYCEANDIDVKKLFNSDTKSIYSRLLKIQGDILNDSSYSYLRLSDGTISNYLLRSLAAGLKLDEKNTRFNGYKFVKLVDKIEGESIDPEQIMKSWDELLNDTSHPELLSFARDLVVYAYAVSADTGGLFDMCKYVPNSFKLTERDSFGRTYADYMRYVQSIYINGSSEDLLTESDIEDIAMNNLMHKSGLFVHHMTDKEASHLLVVEEGKSLIGANANIYAGLSKKIKVKIDPVTGRKLFYVDHFDLAFDGQFPKYIAEYTPESNIKYHIYKIVDWGLIGDKKFPIYAHVNQRGRKFKYGYRVSEYGNNRNVSERDQSTVSRMVESVHSKTLRKIRRKLMSLYNAHTRFAQDVEGNAFFIKDVLSEISASIVNFYDKAFGMNPLFKGILQASSAVDTHLEISVISKFERPLITEDDGLTNKYTDISDDQANTIDPLLVYKALMLRGDGSYVGFDAKFYMKSTFGGQKQLLSLHIGFANHPEYGFFELVKDNEPGHYSIHFKTTLSEDDPTDYATKPLTKDMKESLFQALIYTIPEGSQVYASTWGDLTEGGFHGIHSLGERSNGQLVKVGEREVYKIRTGKYTTKTPLQRYESHNSRYKEKHTSEDYVAHFGGEKTYIPIWQKSGLPIQEQPQQETQSVINIFAGTGENHELSNFAYRPFEHQWNDGRTTRFESVEQAFQCTKAAAFGDVQTFNELLNCKFTGNPNNYEDVKAYGARLKAIGNKVRNYNDGTWKTMRDAFMTTFIRESFVQNKKDAQRLVDTGDAQLTHSQDTGHWGAKFPLILMLIRDEIRKQVDVATNLVKEFGQDYLYKLKDSVKLAQKGLAFYEGLLAILATFTELELDLIAKSLESRLTPQEEQEFLEIRRQYTSKKKIKGTVIDTFGFPATTEGKAAKKRYHELLNKGRFHVASISRFVDPVEHADAIVKMLEENAKKPIGDPSRVYAIEVWSKHDGLPMRRIIEAAKKYKVACMNSFSITGLGDTEYEKGVMRWLDMTDNLIKLAEDGVLDPHSTTIRIDPMLPGKTDPEVIKQIVRKMKAHGFNKFVTSMVLSYGYTQGMPGKQDRKVIEGINQASQRESGTDYNWDYFYGRKANGVVNFLPNQSTSEYKALVQALLDLQAEDKNILIETCAFHINGVDESACLDPLIMERVIGRDFTSEDGSYNRDTSRPDCMCYGAHGGKLAWDNNETCFSSCSYCYAGQSQSNNPLVYYDQDGNLIDNEYTRTSENTPIQEGGSRYNVTISTEATPYKKGLPQQNPNTAYVFTENAQAYVWSTQNREYYAHVSQYGQPRLNVSDSGGTNQAGVRTDSKGNVSQNAFGIVVKKAQQDANGTWLKKEGQFQDTDEDFELFKSLNGDMFDRLNQSGLTDVVFPNQMALGKAALPLRFAQWLLTELNARYGIVSNIEQNTTAGYSGHGLRLSDPNLIELKQQLLTITGSAASTARIAKQIGGIDTLRHPDANGMHFGNPFSHLTYNGVVKQVSSVKEAVVAFEKWLRGEAYQDVEPERRQWIVDQILNGSLLGKPVVYYTDVVPDDSYGVKNYDEDHPNHAHILAKYINNPQLLQQSTRLSATLSGYTLHSGGAHGSDTAWDFFGRKYSLTNAKHYRDLYNLNVSPVLKLYLKPQEIILVTEQELEYARMQINSILNMSLPNTVKGRLKARNYYLVMNADSVYAIANLTQNNHVSGGTDVAVQLGIKMGKPTFVFDLNSEKWYMYNPYNQLFEECPTPVLTKNYAGVGTRDIEQYNIKQADGTWAPRQLYVGYAKKKAAFEAIEKVYLNTIDYLNRSNNFNPDDFDSRFMEDCKG